MDWLRYVQIAGEGEDALYNLYVDGKRVGEALTFDELRKNLEEAEEARACTT